MKRILTFIIALVISVLGLNAQSSGSFDPTFGTDGISRFAVSEYQDFLESVLVQEDGKIITVGRSRTDGYNYGIYASRHNADGTLDETYGEGGISFFKVKPNIYMNGAKDAVLSDDGLLYITGWTYDYENNTSYILCLGKNGYKFPGFGNNGIVETEYGGGIVYEAIDIDSEGNVVVVGYLNDLLLVRRYTADGELDVTFGNNGTVNDTVSNSIYSYGYDVEILEDGKIVVVGSKLDIWHDEFLIQKAYISRYNADGSIDESFGDNGVVDLEVGEYAEFALGVEVDTLGNYLVTGHSELPSIDPDSQLPRYESFIARITKDGALDTTFGENSDGFVRFEAFVGDGCVNSQDASPVVAPDGQIFGTFYSYNHYDYSSCAYVYNLDENGKLKDSFADTGLLPINLSYGDVEIRTMSLAMQNDGKLLVSGYIYHSDGSASDIFISRISTDVEMPEQPNLEAPHFWNPDPSLYANNMTVISTIAIDGVEQSDFNLELGAFCGDEVRGSGKLQYVGSPANRYECFLMVYGNSGDNITFKLYDHATKTELDLRTNESVTFEVNGAAGDVINPYTINFKSKYWFPDQTLYPNNMTVISTIAIDGVEQSDLNLELGAFCGDEVRGSGKLQYVGAPANRYECFLMVYGNAGDNITFKLYDHATETVSDLKTNQSVTFEVNGAVGDVIDPYAINFTSTIVHNQELKSGWNWYSTYVVNEGAEGLANLENAVGTNGIQIKNQSKFVNQAGGNWYGTLEETSVEDMFMIQLSSATNVTLEGYEVNPAEHPITLGTNWKWISYPLSTEMSVEEAFASANPSNGDYVKSQTGFAQYYDGLGWSGTLKTMTPGLGYMYQNKSGYAKTLVYPSSSSKGSVKSNVTTDNNHWTADYSKYPMNMTMIAVVEGAESAYEVAAFADGECRGSARPIYVEALDSYIMFMTISGEDGETLTFKYYDVNTGETYAIADEFTFSVNATVGDVMNPYVMTRGALGIDELSSSINIYPNPVDNELFLATEVRVEEIAIYDVYGRKTTVYGLQTTDFVHSIDVADLEAGVYFVNIKTENGNIVKRFVKK